MEPRERLEHRAERAVARMPLAALSIVLALLANVVGITWWAAVMSERQIAVTESMRLANARIDLVGRKLDEMREGMPTSRDIEQVRAVVADHESRIRAIEKAPVR